MTFKQFHNVWNGIRILYVSGVRDQQDKMLLLCGVIITDCVVQSLMARPPVNFTYGEARLLNFREHLDTEP